MQNKLKWFLSLLVALASINQLAAQSIKRQTISPIGSSGAESGFYISYTVGQPYSTGTNPEYTKVFSAGFQQALSPVKERVKLAIFGRVSIFPNPVVDNTTFIFTEELDNANIRVLDTSGKEVWNDFIKKSNTYSLNCVDWKQGIYFVIVTDNILQKQLNTKIIITK